MAAPISANDSVEAGRLVLSFDIGTTQSAVTVAHLRPDQPAWIGFVDKWRESEMHLARVPTAILYDDKGALLACGAETLAAQDNNNDVARVQPQHFKMQLHPNRLLPTKKALFQRGLARKPIPLSKIYADYLEYLLQRTQEYLRERTGKDIWLDPSIRTDIVLSHPNRWGADQQRFLEKAAIQAGLVTKDGARQYLHFVEEAEAAACFALTDRTLYSLLENGAKFVICDAGGSTIDISAYSVISRGDVRLDLEELDVPSCLDAGGVHVDKELGLHLYEQLYTEPDLRDGGAESVHEMVDDGLEHFQAFGKRKFTFSTDSLEVTIGVRRMNYPNFRVTKGVMNIPSPKAETFFKSYVEQAVDEVSRRAEKHQINIIILSGGFAESPYLKREVENRLARPGRTIAVVNHPVSKAVAVGALYLVAGGEHSMTVVRKQRPWKMWLTNFRKGLREFFGDDNKP